MIGSGDFSWIVLLVLGVSTTVVGGYGWMDGLTLE
jgi:hypothetical protein